MTKSSFMGGSLAFKGDTKKSKKKSKLSKHKKVNKETVVNRKQEEAVAASTVENELEEPDMTEAERRALKRKQERQRQDNEKIAKKSHRERVEELNEHLGSLTELNDIPRVSAAGNG